MGPEDGIARDSFIGFTWQYRFNMNDKQLYFLRETLPLICTGQINSRKDILIDQWSKEISSFNCWHIFIRLVSVLPSWYGNVGNMRSHVSAAFLQSTAPVLLVLVFRFRRPQKRRRHCTHLSSIKVNKGNLLLTWLWRVFHPIAEAASCFPSYWITERYKIPFCMNYGCRDMYSILLPGGHC